MTANAHETMPAILGGPAVRPGGPPPWPPKLPEVEATLQQLACDGGWGRYHGPYGERLRDELARLHGVDHVELCASGTAAVELALRALRIGAGDEVIVAGYDFRGNLANVLAVGATPVLVDIEPVSASLDLARLPEAVTDRTRAVIVSHLHGGAGSVQAVEKILAGRGAVIEDACQMPGATIEGRCAGATGVVGVLSFGGSKLLTAGRGGAVLTRDPAIAHRLRRYLDRGNHAYPLSEMQAAVLLPQLKRLADDNARRQAQVERLCRLLADVPGLTPFRCDLADSAPGYYKLGFWYDPREWRGLSRELWVAALRAEGIAFDAGFRALHLSFARSRYRVTGSLEASQQADAGVVVLHHPVLLDSESALDEVAAAVKKVAAAAERLAASQGPLANGVESTAGDAPSA